MIINFVFCLIKWLRHHREREREGQIMCAISFVAVFGTRSPNVATQKVGTGGYGGTEARVTPPRETTYIHMKAPGAGQEATGCSRGRQSQALRVREGAGSEW